MSEFAVLLSSVGQASAATRSAGADLGAELLRLRREADDVLGGGWRGEAAMAFDRAWGVWDSGAREVLAGLEQLAEALAVTGHEYGVRDEVSASSFGLVGM